MATYGYSRVSTMSQAEDGDSLEAQDRRIAGYCQSEGLTLTRLFVERGVSGSKPFQDRPEGGLLLAALQSGDLIVSPKLDRCFRSASDALASLERLKARCVRLVLLDIGEVTSDRGVGSLLFGVLASVAQWERDRIRERISEVKSMEREQGKFRGGKPPFGYGATAGGMLEPIPVEQAALALILQLAGEERSLRKIQAAVLECLGLKLSHVAINRVIRDAKISKPAASSAA